MYPERFAVLSIARPGAIALIFAVLGRTVVQQSEQPLSLAVAAENAPGLIQFLKQNDVEIRPAPADPEAEVWAGNYDVILLIPAGYGEDFVQTARRR